MEERLPLRAERLESGVRAAGRGGGQGSQGLLDQELLEGADVEVPTRGEPVGLDGDAAGSDDDGAGVLDARRWIRLGRGLFVRRHGDGRALRDAVTVYERSGRNTDFAVWSEPMPPFSVHTPDAPLGLVGCTFTVTTGSLTPM